MNENDMYMLLLGMICAVPVGGLIFLAIGAVRETPLTGSRGRFDNYYEPASTIPAATTADLPYQDGAAERQARARYIQENGDYPPRPFKGWGHIGPDVGVQRAAQAYLDARDGNSRRAKAEGRAASDKFLGGIEEWRRQRR